MARNIPSLFTLTANRLYNLGVRPPNLEQYNFPAEQLLERYEDFAREKAASIIQDFERRRNAAKVRIIRILRRIERQRRSVGLRARNIIANYEIGSYEGLLITEALAKLSIEDFIQRYSGPFWWALVRNGIYSYATLRNDYGAEVQRYRQLNGNILLGIIRNFCQNIELYINNGIIHPMDVGGQLIRMNCPAFLSNYPGQMVYPVTWRAALMIWEESFSRLGELPPRPRTPPPKRRR